MDELIFSVYGELELGDLCRSLWEPALPHLSRCLDDEAPFLAALADVARSTGLSQSVPVGVLLEAYGDGPAAGAGSPFLLEYMQAFGLPLSGSVVSQ